MYRSNIFESLFFLLSSSSFFSSIDSIKMKRKPAIDSRPDMRLRSIDERRADEEVFLYIYTLETNKK